MPKITPSLWYSEKAVEAAEFYVSLLPGSSIDRVSGLSAKGETGGVEIVEFTLAGQPFQAFSAGPYDDFNHAVSFTISCEDQAEVDRLWDALVEGGKAEQCGWLRDRYGLSWQIVPKRLGVLMGDPDREKAGRVAKAMRKMVKFDIAALEAAHRGEGEQ